MTINRCKSAPNLGGTGDKRYLKAICLLFNAMILVYILTKSLTISTIFTQKSANPNFPTCVVTSGRDNAHCKAAASFK